MKTPSGMRRRLNMYRCFFPPHLGKALQKDCAIKAGQKRKHCTVNQQTNPKKKKKKNGGSGGNDRGVLFLDWRNHNSRMFASQGLNSLCLLAFPLCLSHPFSFPFSCTASLPLRSLSLVHSTVTLTYRLVPNVSAAMPIERLTNFGM